MVLRHFLINRYVALPLHFPAKDIHQIKFYGNFSKTLQHHGCSKAVFWVQCELEITKSQNWMWIHSWCQTTKMYFQSEHIFNDFEKIFSLRCNFFNENVRQNDNITLSKLMMLHANSVESICTYSNNMFMFIHQVQLTNPACDCLLGWVKDETFPLVGSFVSRFTCLFSEVPLC